MSYSLKIKQLECFIAVAEELNFRRAAERLYITQPPLSRQIKKLEETIGMQLFERNRQGVRMTKNGERFLNDARILLNYSNETLNKVREYVKEEAVSDLKIGVTTVIDIQIFQDLVFLFQKKHPNINLSIIPQRSLNLIKHLKTGELDVALIGLPSLTEDLIVEHLFFDPMVVALPTHHQLLRKKQLMIADLQDETLFWFSRKLNPAYYDHCVQIFKSLKFTPKVIPEPSDYHVFLGLIAGKKGVGLVPSSLKTIKREGVRYKKLFDGDRISIGIGVAFCPGNDSILVKDFVKTMREYFTNYSQDIEKCPLSAPHAFTKPPHL